MLRCDSTLRKIQIILSGIITTNQLPVMVMYSDRTSTAYSGAAQLANTNSTTAVDICAAPAASTIRDIDYISVRNSDTVAATVTIRYNDNATLYTIVTVTLAVGDQLVYVHGDGWRVVDASGYTKVTNIALTGGVTTVGNVATVVTNANLTGGVTSVGNAATVVTNANLAGHVTSVGNAAVLGSFTLAQLNTAVSDADVVSIGGTETITGLKTFTATIGQLFVASSPGTNYAKIHVSNDGGTLQIAIENSVGGNYGAPAYARVIWNDGAYPTIFYTAATRRMSIESGGNVLIGSATNLSNGILQVTGTVYATGLRLDYTNTATVGAVTINKASGRVNIAAAGTSVVVTNSLVTVASHVVAVVSTNDTTARVTSVVPAAGSFTINTVATTAATSFDFVVFNAD